jgi:hypothetical protein
MGPSLLPKVPGVTTGKRRKFGQEFNSSEDKQGRAINILVAGWGARIRTWDCRGKLCI